MFSSSCISGCVARFFVSAAAAGMMPSPALYFNSTLTPPSFNLGVFEFHSSIPGCVLLPPSPTTILAAERFPVYPYMDFGSVLFLPC